MARYMQFLDRDTDKDIVLRLEHNSNKFRLEESFNVWYEINGEKQTIIIGEGMETDLATIPPLLQVFLSPTDPTIAIPALIHDFLYMTHLTTKEEADVILFEKCLSFGMGFIRASLVYLAVRLFGTKAWNKYHNVRR